MVAEVCHMQGSQQAKFYICALDFPKEYIVLAAFKTTKTFLLGCGFFLSTFFFFLSQLFGSFFVILS